MVREIIDIGGEGSGQRAHDALSAEIQKLRDTAVSMESKCRENPDGEVAKELLALNKKLEALEAAQKNETP